MPIDTTRLYFLGNPGGREYCSPDDIRTFVSTLALPTKFLSLRSTPEILYALYDVPKLEISTLRIEKLEFSALDCTRFVNLLQRCERPPAFLFLQTCYIEDPLVLAEGLVHIKALAMGCCPLRNNNSPSERPNYPSLGDMLVGEGGNGIMQRLLQSPVSQLKVLRLVRAQLDNRHFMAIVDMLPTSQLEELLLLSNGITWRGILAFAHQLPQITCLKTMNFGFAESERDCPKAHHQECCIALTQGMHENYSIEFIHMDKLSRPPYEGFHFSYYADLNRAGRRILVTSKAVPAGLWPRILERVGTIYRYSCPESQESKRVNAIYYLLQNCQALLAVH